MSCTVLGFDDSAGNKTRKKNPKASETFLLAARQRDGEGGGSDRLVPSRRTEEFLFYFGASGKLAEGLKQRTALPSILQIRKISDYSSIGLSTTWRDCSLGPGERRGA